MKTGKNALFIIAGIILFNLTSFGILIAAETAKASPSVDDNYFPEFKAEDDMKSLKTGREPFAISYGGWIDSVYIDDRSGNGSGSTTLSSSVSIAKAWLKTALSDSSYIYLRGMDLFSYYITTPEGSDLDWENTVDLDVGFYSASFADNTINLAIGRKIFLLGTGLAYNGRGDGAGIDVYTKYADITLFGSYTGLLVDNTNPYRLSTQEFTDQGKRIFAGGSISKSIANQTLYVMALTEFDLNDDNDNSDYPDAEGKYTAQYYGAGFKGIYGNAFYYGEFIYETGSGYTDYVTASNDKEDISAFAGLAGFHYYFDVKTKPALLIDYAYGSGDKDRNLTNSPTGNIEGKDTGFMYFGTYTGGYALRPYLSNIHVAQAGISISPFSGFQSPAVNRLNLIAKYSNYQKDKAEAPINRSEATLNKRDIGHGIDLSLRWMLFSDLSFYTNFGMFIPGSAYGTDEKTRTFAMAGIHLAF